MVKVIHILPSPKLGGVQTNLLLKSNYDKKYKIDRKVIYTVSSEGELLNRGNKLFEKYVHCPIMPIDRGYRPYRLFKLYRRWLSLFFIFRLFAVLKKDDSLIVHPEDGLKLFSQIIATLLAKKIFLWQIHTSENLIKIQFLKRIIKRLINRGKITLIVVSKSALAANFGCNNINKKIYFIPGGIEIKNFNFNNNNRNKNRKYYGFDQDELIIGSTGRLHWAKGYDILLKSISQIIINNDVQLKLLIAGEGQSIVDLIFLGINCRLRVNDT